MRKSTFRRAAIVMGLGCLAAGAAVPASVVGCSETAGHGKSSPAPAEPPDPGAEAAIAALRTVRARFAEVIEAPRDGRLARIERTASGAIRAERAERAAIVDLPAEAGDAVRVADEGSGVAVSFALEDARSAPAAIAEGFAVYAGAAPSGGDVVFRVTPSGAEDFVYFSHDPGDERLRYRVDVRGVAGLRLVDRTLEFLDAGGAPRLRIAPPEVVGAEGRRARADLAIEGCAVDRSPRAPWGRPVTKPGAPECTVSVTWADRGVAYPAIVDPAWILTKTMVVERAQHASTMLPNPAAAPDDASPVLITGGFDKNDAPLASAEIYEPLSRTFAATGAMNKVRAAHTATPIGTSAIGQILVAGGAVSIVNKNPPEQLAFASLADGQTIEIYNPQTGLFTLTPSVFMSVPRFRHTASALPDGRILLAGGITDAVNQPTKAADLFAFDPAASPPGSITPAAPLVSARSAHAAARLSNGSILITGGIGSASFALLTGEVYTSALGTFAQSPGLMTAARAFHTATTLSSGEVLLAGGVNAQSAPIAYSSTADIYVNGTFSPAAITMSAPRAFHTATHLAPTSVVTPGSPPDVAEVIFAGGFDGLADIGTTDAYFPVTKKILASPAIMQRTRRHAVSALVNAGNNAAAGRGVVVIGGVNGSTTTAMVLTNGQSTKTAEVLAKGLGEPCDQTVNQGQGNGQECLSGFCADGVCCNKACQEQCRSCTAALKEDNSADGLCGPTKAGTTVPVYCFDDLVNEQHIEVHGICDGQGLVQPGPGTHSCYPAPCGPNGFCIEYCSPTDQCSATGWCDFETAPGADAGVPDGGGPFGTCQQKKKPGLTCKQGVECLTGFCIDGYCCNEVCNDQCRACDLASAVGTCTRVGTIEPGGQPHANDAGNVFDPDAGTTTPRPACNGFGTTCGGACQMPNVDKCEYPDAGAELSDPACTDTDGGPSTLVRFRCDSDGGSLEDPKDCGGYRCKDGATACKAACSRANDAGDTDCIQDFVCEDDGGKGACVALDSPRCDGHKTIRMPVAQGGYQECPDHYACPSGADACLKKCASVADCVDGYVCNGDKECVKQLSAPSPDELPSCAAGRPAGKGRAPVGWGAAALGLLALAARRRRAVSIPR